MRNAITGSTQYNLLVSFLCGTLLRHTSSLYSRQKMRLISFLTVSTILIFPLIFTDIHSKCLSDPPFTPAEYLWSSRRVLIFSNIVKAADKMVLSLDGNDSGLDRKQTFDRRLSKNRQICVNFPHFAQVCSYFV